MTRNCAPHITADNLYAALPEDLPEELVQVIGSVEGVRIERIVSRGHCSAEGFWYDQDRPEFVLLVCGEAKLALEGRQETIHLKPGDFLTIPAHLRHRVEWTTPAGDTIWLAVHF